MLRRQEQREALAEGQLLSTLKHPHGASVIPVIHDLGLGDLPDTSMVDIWLVYGEYMVSIWLVYGQYMVSIWLVYGDMSLLYLLDAYKMVNVYKH
jgi:hypothetical protein